MYNYSVELQIWALRRYVDEMVHKADRLQKRRMEVEELARQDKIRGLRVGRGYVAQVATLTLDIERYQNEMARSIKDASDLFSLWGTNDEVILYTHIMRDAFGICGSQRVEKYAQLLGWRHAMVREYAVKNKGLMTVYDIQLGDFSYDLVGGVGLLNNQKMLIANHGGMHCFLDYRAVRHDFIFEKLTIEQKLNHPYIPF